MTGGDEVEEEKNEDPDCVALYRSAAKEAPPHQLRDKK